MIYKESSPKGIRKSMEEVGHRREENKQGYDPEQSPSDFCLIPGGALDCRLGPNAVLT